MPTLSKLLSKFSIDQRAILIALIEKILTLNWHGLDIKKLQGHGDVFRLRKGKIRIIFIKDKNKKIIRIIDIGYRNEKTYKL
ncbi:MAG: type II toxin-antitoxin system RelE/ParE family toxin [bacterium]|nr:type II toxin-antitoxin system RelE/ParE family toxin [bacterium]